MSMFNSRGELNASSLKEAFQTIAKYSSLIEEGQPSNMQLAGQPSMTDVQQDELISRAMYTQEGKQALAQAMANPKV